MRECTQIIYDAITYLGALAAFVLTIYIYLKQKRNEKLVILKKQVAAYYILEQHYMNYIAEKEGKAASKVQIDFRKLAEDDEQNKTKTRPTMTAKEAEKITSFLSFM